MALTARDCMRSPVRSVSPRMRVPDLEQLLLRERISGAPVLEDGRLVGIVSRTDIVRELLVEQTLVEGSSSFYLEPFDTDAHPERDRALESEAVAARWKGLTVADVMVHELVRVGPDEPVGGVARTMLERRVHRLLVTEGDELLGLVSSLDLVRLLAEERVRPA